MRILIATAWLTLTAVALVSGVAYAQTQSSNRVPTVSRLVKLFSEQEARLAERIAARDATGAGNMLTDDFELRASNLPGRPIPRADWLAQSMQSTGVGSRITQMAVHDLGDTAVVSFLQGPDTTASLFVVDVWQRAGDDWKLKARYASPTAGNVPIPGVPPADKNLPKKY